MLAPRDDEAGGTWIGLSPRGVVAAVTNRFTGRPADPVRRSRGELVGLALAHDSAAAAAGALMLLDARTWNPFHLVIADARSAWRWDDHGAASLAPGLHVVTELTPGADEREAWLRSQWPATPDVDALHALMSTHGEQPFSRCCVHYGETYGTRSSTLVFLGPVPPDARLFVADRRPCEQGFTERADLLAAAPR